MKTVNEQCWGQVSTYISLNMYSVKFLVDNSNKIIYIIIIFGFDTGGRFVSVHLVVSSIINGNKDKDTSLNR
jgi:hypothetical protein